MLSRIKIAKHKQGLYGENVKTLLCNVKNMSREYCMFLMESNSTNMSILFKELCKGNANQSRFY